jgi:predicted nuclease of predicted toxin-antitoxin system
MKLLIDMNLSPRWVKAVVWTAMREAAEGTAEHLYGGEGNAK